MSAVAIKSFIPGTGYINTWSTGNGPKEYGQFLQNRRNKKLKSWQKANRK